MKSIITVIAILITAQFSSAHGVPPSVDNYTKTILLAADYAGDTVGYPETIFDSLVGISTIQDTARKIRVIKFKFTSTNCTKDLEIYAKLDGSAVLSHKVVGCGQ